MPSTAHPPGAPPPHLPHLPRPQNNPPPPRRLLPAPLLAPHSIPPLLPLARPNRTRRPPHPHPRPPRPQQRRPHPADPERRPDAPRRPRPRKSARRKGRLRRRPQHGRARGAGVRRGVPGAHRVARGRRRRHDLRLRARAHPRAAAGHGAALRAGVGGVRAWTRAESLVPEWAVRRALGLVEEEEGAGGEGSEEAWPRTVRTLELCRGVVGVLVAGQETRPLKARTLVLAATKGGVVPTDDNVDAARDAWKALSQGNAESRAVKIASMRHPWNEQDPKLFAESILAWMEKRALPGGFEDL